MKPSVEQFEKQPANERARIAAILNALHAAEASSIFRYLAGSSPFVARGNGRQGEALRAMTALTQQQMLRLEEALNDLDASPTPTSFPRDYTSLHYVSLQFLASRLIAGKEAIIAQYQKAKQGLNALPTDLQTAARAVVDEGLRAHEKQLEILRREHGHGANK